MTKVLRRNQAIQAQELCLIDENNIKIGVVTLDKALSLAKERGYDLLEVSPSAKPPVCKLLDYGQYQYQQEKAERKSKHKHKKVEIKGIRLTLKIGEHDLEIRAKQAQKFLEKGHKVRIEMFLRGRELAHLDLAREIINNFKDSIDNVVTEQPLTKQGGKLTILISQKK